MASLSELHELGQSTWLNFLRNSYIRSGELAEALRVGIQGVTVDTRVYQRAISGASDYDAGIRRGVAEGKAVRRIHEALMVDDIQRAADVLHPVFEASDRRDGFVSFEIEPSLLREARTTVAEVRHLVNLIDRYNVMVELPATLEGIEAMRALVTDGVSVNATHLFSPAAFERVAAAYMAGLAEFLDSHSVWRTAPTVVASFSLAPIDAMVDARLLALGRGDLGGRTALAVARTLYARSLALFSGPAWEKLAARYGRPLRLKWTRTTPPDFRHDPLYYVNRLAAADTVLTLSPALVSAFEAAGAPQPLGADISAAEAHLAELGSLGIDLEPLANQLRQNHLQTTDRRFQWVMDAIARKRDELDRPRPLITARLGAAQAIVDEGLAELCRRRIVCRIWQHDHTVWKPRPTEITNRLGWLHIMNPMAENVARLDALAPSLTAEGFRHVLLLGMGGSSLAPELFQKTFADVRGNRPHLDLVVLDTTDADAVRAAEHGLDLSKTIVIVATKSGGTVETLSGFKYFYNRLLEQAGPERVGRHFIGITDPGSKIAEMAAQYGFRDLFLNDPTIGGRYSALSYFGLVPAALVGVDVAELLERAALSASNGRLCHCDVIGDNHAAVLGVALGRLALAGRDKVTFITSSALASFGDWVEQLIAESTGKEGKGILPVVGEPAAPVETYGPDRLFVHLRLDGDTSQDAFVAALAEAGHPALTIHLRDRYDVGGEFFIWELATTIASTFLQINPFDQPNVEAAKVKARDIVAEFTDRGQLPGGDLAAPEAHALHAFLAHARPGDYVALQAYVAATPATNAALQALRQAIHLRTGLATTAGYGPRFLHSTGQLHKGDRGNGLFIQFVSDAAEDLPIPDEAGAAKSAMSFNVLKKAQALGDARALRDAQRRVLAIQTGPDATEAIEALAAQLG